MTYLATDFDSLEALALGDVDVLRSKGETYGDSWRQRGGVGAFMTFARKWDRIEHQAEEYGYDVFEAHRACPNMVDGLIDDIADLRRYLLLLEEHLHANETDFEEEAMVEIDEEEGEATSAYVNQ